MTFFTPFFLLREMSAFRYSSQVSTCRVSEVRVCVFVCVCVRVHACMCVCACAALTEDKKRVHAPPGSCWLPRQHERSAVVSFVPVSLYKRPKRPSGTGDDDTPCTERGLSIFSFFNSSVQYLVIHSRVAPTRITGLQL